MIQLEVIRKDFGQTRAHEYATPVAGPGEIVARIDKFALTANNVSYAFSGDMIGYWKFFPAEGDWGIVPVWGFADVIASQHPGIAAGERIWGFLPMASHVRMRPDRVSPRGFSDGADHRAGLPGIYNAYQRTGSDPSEMTALEDERCLLFPLFATSYILYDYLIDNAFFGAEQILVGSASSKTGLGLCNLLHHHQGARPRVLGLTSARNADFVKRLGYCDDVVTYDALTALDASKSAAIVDMSGDGAVVKALHRHFGAKLKLSCAVGATHWQGERYRGEPGTVPHDFFFAPAQFAKRDSDWGPGEALRRAQAESARMAGDLRGILTIEHIGGTDAVAGVWKRLVAGSLPPDTGIMASIPG